MSHAAPRIIVADDEALIREFINELLTDEGYAVTVFQKAAAAYQSIVAVIPDAVILDLQIETRHSGIQVLQMMRLRASTAAIPVILMSANVMVLRAKRERLLAHDCTILEKPFDVDELLSCVRSALGHQRMGR